MRGVEGKRGMASAERRTGNAEWGTANGERGTANAEWRLRNGECGMETAERRMRNGECGIRLKVKYLSYILIQFWFLEQRLIVL